MISQQPQREQRDPQIEKNQPVEQSKREPFLSDVVPGAWAGYNLLTAEEATELQEAATRLGMTHVEQPGAEGALVDARLRDCTRCTIERPDIAALVWERIRPHLAESVDVDGSDECQKLGLPAEHEKLHGTWRPYGVNPVLRICRYPGAGRGHFGPHADSSVEKSYHDRSLLTINGYLNALPEGVGGCTRFLVDDLGMYQDQRGRFTVKDVASVRGAIRPEAPGMAACFFHGLIHDSEPLSADAPAKWIWRTEVMYRRDPETAPALNATDELVRLIEYSGERVEREQAMVAMELYKLAARLRDGRVTYETALARFEALRPAESEEGEYNEGAALDGLKRLTT